METAAASTAVAFAGTFTGAFALAVACLGGESFAALLTLGMTMYCAAEFAYATERARLT